MEGRTEAVGHGAAAVVLDVDGVLHKGPEPIAGAREALERLEAAGVPFIFVTNSGGETEEGKAAHYRRLLGWDAISPARLVQSHTPMRGLLPRFADRPVLAVGSSVASATRVMTNYGFTNFVTIQEFARRHPFLYPSKRYDSVEPASETTTPGATATTVFEAIFILNHPEDWGEALQICVDLVLTNGNILDTSRPRAAPITEGAGDEEQQQLPVFLANPDLAYANQFHLMRFTNGAFHVCLEALYKSVSGRELKSVLFGKPYRATYEYAIRRITELLEQRGHAEPPQRIYAVGDNPLSDIKGANGMGWTSILVRTGCFQSTDDNDAQHPATHVCPSITEAVDYILQQEGLGVGAGV